MSPILVRPVREQLEHDRVIRLLQQDLQKRKVEVGINPGAEQNVSVGVGSRKEFPDAVIYSLEKGKKVVAVVEVETGESVNHLEAMAQWAHLAKLRVPFHLYVPINSVDVARRLSADYKINVSEIWSYHQAGEQFKFTLIHPLGARAKGVTPPPRTVSVATIRVALPAEIELPPAEEPPLAPPVAPPPAPAAVRTVPVKVKPAPAATPTVPKMASTPPARVAAPRASRAGSPAGKSAVKGAAPTKALAAPTKAVATPTKAVAARPVKPLAATARPKPAGKPVPSAARPPASAVAARRAKAKLGGARAAAARPVAKKAKPAARAAKTAARPSSRLVARRK